MALTEPDFQSGSEARFQIKRLELIEAGQNQTTRENLTCEPSFLANVEAALPKDLRGWLCLVGAGVWAEIYCHWIKQRLSLIHI